MRQAFDAVRQEADSAEMRVAEADIERSQQTLKMLKNMQLGYDMHAPFDALVVKRLVEPGTARAAI